MGKIDSPGQLEVIESFNGQLSVEHFKSYVEKSKESGRNSFSNSKQRRSSLWKFVNLLLLLITLAGTCLATSPTKLVSQDACRWGAESEGEGENKLVVMDKGCPQYYTKKCKNVNVKFSTKKENGEDILIVDWSAITKTPDGKLK